VLSEPGPQNRGRDDVIGSSMNRGFRVLADFSCICRRKRYSERVCGRGEIGRRTILKMSVPERECRFKSCRPHHQALTRSYPDEFF
jgi:hypothetical protein